MKKHLQNFIMLVAVSFAASVFGQPVLTNTNCNPIIGDQFTHNLTNYVSPGSAGANQTWNLSAMTATATNSASFVTVASTPLPSFPNANMSFKSGTTYKYYKTTTTALQNCNGVASGSITIQYTDLEDQLHFPFNYNNSYSDTWQGSYAILSTNFIRKGTTTVTADGYGTLTTPAGTFTNVMRVHLYTAYKDSIISNGFVFNRTDEEYRWYAPNSHYHVASVYTSTNSSNPNTTGGSYMDNFVNVGINEYQNQFSNVNLFPTPASDVLNISFPESISNNVEVSVSNVQGQELKKQIYNTQLSSNQTMNVSDLPAGVYFLQLKADGVASCNKRFVITK